jgi:hypothetical protein
MAIFRPRLIWIVLAILLALIYQDALLSQVYCRHDIAERAACDADLSIHNRKIEPLTDARALEYRNICESFRHVDHELSPPSADRPERSFAFDYVVVLTMNVEGLDR